MKEIKFFCDVCGKEFPPNEYSFLTGQLIKVDKDLKSHQIPFEGHYCGDDTIKVLSYIENLKKEVDNKIN